jgi:hypothetical protein
MPPQIIGYASISASEQDQDLSAQRNGHANLDVPEDGIPWLRANIQSAVQDTLGTSAGISCFSAPLVP